MKKLAFGTSLALASLLALACTTTPTEVNMEENINTPLVPNTSEAWKPRGQHNPVMTQRYGADPWVMVHDDTVWLYMTGDVIEKDSGGTIKENTYGTIHTINVLSSKDLVNWTDWGSVNVRSASSWARNSWAPAATFRETDEGTEFFLYFANNASSIGVLRAKHPAGPFTDPIGKPLVTRETPNCRDITWLFDPAVLKDDDGSQYLYFGGGVPEGKTANPKTSRAVKLGADCISLDGDPVLIDAPYIFEDSGINKLNGKYWYSYCTNWQVPESAKTSLGMSSGQIAIMSSNSPLGPFTYEKVIFKNPGVFFGDWGNNHHALFEFKGSWYLAYHARLLENRQRILKGYRSTHIDKVPLGEDGIWADIRGTPTGVDAVGTLDPYQWQSAATMSSQSGLQTVGATAESRRHWSGPRAISGIDRGDWLFLEDVAFGEAGANTLELRTRQAEGIEAHEASGFELRLGGPDGELVATYRFDEQSAADSGQEWYESSLDLQAPLTGTHDIFIIFTGRGFEMASWRFK